MLFTSYRWQLFILYDVVFFVFVLFYFYFHLILFNSIHSYFILNLISDSAEVLYCCKPLKAQMFWCLGLIAGKSH